MPSASVRAERRARSSTRTPLPAALVAALLIAVLVGAAAALPAGVRAASQTMVPACTGVNLRTGTSTTTTVKARLSSGTLTVTGTQSGSAWSTDCAGPKAGSGWYRISHVNGKAVSTLYGVPVVYAATGVLRAAPATTPTPTPKPTPRPAPTPTPGAAADPLARELMRLINLDRAAVGKPAFAIDAGLVAIARDARFACPTKPSLVLRGRAADLAARAYFGHFVKGCYARRHHDALPVARHRAHGVRLPPGPQRDPPLEHAGDVGRDLRARL